MHALEICLTNFYSGMNNKFKKKKLKNVKTQSIAKSKNIKIVYNVKVTWGFEMLDYYTDFLCTVF